MKTKPNVRTRRRSAYRAQQERPEGTVGKRLDAAIDPLAEVRCPRTAVGETCPRAGVSQGALFGVYARPIRILSLILAAVVAISGHASLAAAQDDGLDSEKRRVPVHVGSDTGGVAEPVIPAGAKGGEVKPGDHIDKTNVDKVKELISPGVRWCVENGMEIDVVPYQQIPVPADYRAATEKYAAQVKLKADNTLENWVAGKPFPNVDINDPQAAQKIMYNFRNTHYFSETLDLNLVDADTGSLYIDADGNRRYDIERHFVPEWLRAVRYEGRLKHDPKPLYEPNNDRTFMKSGLYPLIEPFDLKGVGGVSYRYQDQTRQDDTWLYLPSVRRVRRMSSSQRSDALFGQDIDIDSYGGYAGQIPWFEWKLLGEKPLLMSMHGQRLPAQPCKMDGGMTFCEPWELRPSVYVVQGRSRIPGYAYSSRVIYVDKESGMIGYSDLQDPTGQLWKVVMLSFRVDKKPNPNIDFSYPEARMFAYAYSVVDVQLMHGTRASIPGMAFQNEPGWYLDLGPDAPSSVGEDWYTIAQLVKAGR